MYYTIIIINDNIIILLRISETVRRLPRTIWKHCETLVCDCAADYFRYRSWHPARGRLERPARSSWRSLIARAAAAAGSPSFIYLFCFFFSFSFFLVSYLVHIAHLKFYFYTLPLWSCRCYCESYESQRRRRCLRHHLGRVVDGTKRV